MQLKLSDALCSKYPDLTKNEIRMLLRPIWNTKSNKLKRGHIVNFTIPHLGRCKSHGNKKKKDYKAKDARIKRKLYQEKQLTREKLLF